jgi:hypothetical protein
MNGTIHVTLGLGFDYIGGTNESAIHWDIVKDLRSGGRIELDGKTVQESGPESRRVWRNVARCRGAMVFPRQGRREPSYWFSTGATEDARLGASSAARRLSVISPNPPTAPSRTGTWSTPRSRRR